MLKWIEKVGRRRVYLQKKKSTKFGRDNPGKNYRGTDFDGQTPRPPWAGCSPLGSELRQDPRPELGQALRPHNPLKSSFKKNMNHEHQTPLSTDAVSGTSHGKPDPRHHPSQVGIFTHLILKRYSSARWCGFATVALPAPGPLGRRLRS